jgi:hypothetical protein
MAGWAADAPSKDRALGGNRGDDFHRGGGERRGENRSGVNQKAVHKPDIEFVRQLVGLVAPKGVGHAGCQIGKPDVSIGLEN